MRSGAWNTMIFHEAGQTGPLCHGASNTVAQKPSQYCAFVVRGRIRQGRGGATSRQVAGENYWGGGRRKGSPPCKNGSVPVKTYNGFSRPLVEKRVV